jgi:hypothetical protein
MAQRCFEEAVQLFLLGIRLVLKTRDALMLAGLGSR